jgi:hypothetical protein
MLCSLLMCGLRPMVANRMEIRGRKKHRPSKVRRFDKAPSDCRDDVCSGTVLCPHWGGAPTASGAHSAPPAGALTFRINELLAGLPA